MIVIYHLEKTEVMCIITVTQDKIFHVFDGKDKSAN